MEVEIVRRIEKKTVPSGSGNVSDLSGNSVFVIWRGVRTDKRRQG